MFQLHDIRKSKVWQEAHETGKKKGIEKGIEEGIEKGREEGKAIAQCEFVRNCLSKGMSAKQIAELTKLPLKTVRRIAKNPSN